VRIPGLHPLSRLFGRRRPTPPVARVELPSEPAPAPPPPPPPPPAVTRSREFDQHEIGAPNPARAAQLRLQRQIKEAVDRGAVETTLNVEAAATGPPSGSGHRSASPGAFGCVAHPLSLAEIDVYIARSQSEAGANRLDYIVPGSMDPLLETTYRECLRSIPHADRAALYRIGGMEEVRAMALRLANHRLGRDRPRWRRVVALLRPGRGDA
jgi:hypothetical protein